MNMHGDVKRRYQSPLRQAQARTTRKAVIGAAARLFAERGYVTTSIDDIAAAAGVSRATVFSSVGGKAVLLKTAFDVAIVGDDEPVALPDRPRSKAIREEPDQRRYLALYAGLVTEMWVRLGGIYEAVRGAASADPEARGLWETHQAQRRVGAANVVGDLQRKGSLREGLEVEAAADIVWVLNDPGLYHQLVDRQGWAPETFARWLAEAMQRLLLADELPTGVSSRPPDA
ncbi:MAG: TetR/AcrR family transcriptional regulator [Candidatus Dormibacteraeota bacterium]|nr:TetR/AcrR family transcriptional regulator [Candidatus Dormibacteraeota bacterium]